MIRVTTGSRLHFGLFSVPGAEPTNLRRFGGVGLMVEQPGLDLRIEHAASWSAQGPSAERALEFARRLVQALELRQAFALNIARAAPEHVGLGTGTQLALAVGLAVARACNTDLSVATLAGLLGRGQRSALGVHGFAVGGFLVEGGKGPDTVLSPLVARADFPDAWRLVLVTPREGQGLHGQLEGDAFRRLAQQKPGSGTCDALCRLTLLGLLPALADRDLRAFGEALFEFNRRVGEMFLPVQGGIYSCQRTAEVINFVRQQGVLGTGQSSWGPTVFAVMDADQAAYLASRLHEKFALAAEEVIVTQARNQPAC